MMVVILSKIAAIILGIILLFWGVWASFEARRPFNTIGAVCAPLGLILALLGTLILCVPDFFRW